MIVYYRRFGSTYRVPPSKGTDRLMVAPKRPHETTILRCDKSEEEADLLINLYCCIVDGYFCCVVDRLYFFTFFRIVLYTVRKS